MEFDKTMYCYFTTVTHCLYRTTPIGRASSTILVSLSLDTYAILLTCVKEIKIWVADRSVGCSSGLLVGYFWGRYIGKVRLGSLKIEKVEV